MRVDQRLKFGLAQPRAYQAAQISRRLFAHFGIDRPGEKAHEQLRAPGRLANAVLSAGGKYQRLLPIRE